MPRTNLASTTAQPHYDIPDAMYLSDSVRQSLILPAACTACSELFAMIIPLSPLCYSSRLVFFPSLNSRRVRVHFCYYKSCWKSKKLKNNEM